MVTLLLASRTRKGAVMLPPEETISHSAAPVVAPALPTDERDGTEFARLFRKCSLFSGLDTADLATLAARAHRRRLVQGEPIFHAGAPGDSLVGVLVGAVRISLPSRGGKELILADIQAGEVFGEIAMLDGGVRSADAVAVTNCDLVILERRDIVPFLLQRPELCLRLISLICGRLRLADERTLDIAFLDLSARLAKVLLERSSASRSARLGFSQSEMAHMIGASREKVNRQLKQWEREGLVALRNGWIIVREREALAAMVGEEPQPGHPRQRL